MFEKDQNVAVRAKAQSQGLAWELFRKFRSGRAVSVFSGVVVHIGQGGIQTGLQVFFVGLGQR